ncbi:MAG: DegT/DnrJ/EryC1/StrS aminotransferase family protein, partial [Planctomycetota bacterium]
MGPSHGTGIPLCDLQAQYRELQTEMEEAVCRVLASGQVILGPEVAALEDEVARFCGIGHAVGCSSGT